MKSVAFDFDGVIHTDVSNTDSNGNRHPTIPFSEVGRNKFDYIIDLIHRYHRHNYKIYIVTARSSKSKHVVRNTLTKFNVSPCIIPDENLFFTGDYGRGGDKVDTLEHLNINHFYDDSISHFKSIYSAKKQNRLGNLRKCYLTKPEKNTVIKLDI
jgi:hypothetical protein